MKVPQVFIYRTITLLAILRPNTINNIQINYYFICIYKYFSKTQPVTIHTYFKCKYE